MRSDDYTERAGRLLYNTTEAGEQLSISRAEIWRLIGRGELRGVVKIGRLTRVPHTALIEYVERLQRDAGRDAGRDTGSDSAA